MIAKNYIKHPDALRFQHEMFGRGHTGHYPRIMRLMEVIFDWTPTVPQWVKDAKARAAQIVKAWKSRQLELFEMIKKKAYRYYPIQMELVLFPDAPEQATEAQSPTPKLPDYMANARWNPRVTVTEWATNGIEHAGHYRSFCRAHQGGFQSYPKRVADKTAYGFSI